MVKFGQLKSRGLVMVTDRKTFMVKRNQHLLMGGDGCEKLNA